MPLQKPAISSTGSFLVGQHYLRERLLGIDVYRTELKGVRLSKSTIFDVFKRPPWVYKDKLLEERSRKLTGLPYRDFLQQRAAFSDFDKKLAEIADYDLECELIFAGFVNSEVYIFVVWGDGAVSYEDDFAAIGSGADFAVAMLRYRNHHSGLSLWETMYHVYEAKKFAEMEPHVGKKTFLDVLRPRVGIG
jgi:hypothetical protein